MVLGRQEPESTAHGIDYTVNPIEDLELSDQLHDAVKYIRGTYQEAALPELGEGEAIDTSIPADPDVKTTPILWWTAKCTSGKTAAWCGLISMPPPKSV